VGHPRLEAEDIERQEENYSWSQDLLEYEEEEDDFEDGENENVGGEREGGRVLLQNMEMSAEEYMSSRVPAKTKQATEAAVKMFNMWTADYNKEFGTDWCENIDNIHDEDLAPALAAWLQGLARPTGDLYNASSLVTYANSMARHLKTTRRTDIKRDPEFYDFQQILKYRQQDSAAAAKLPGINASNPLDIDDLNKAWRAGMLGDGSPKAAGATMVLNLLGMCGFRSVEEVYQLKNCDFTASVASQGGGIPDWVEVSERVSKTRRGYKGGCRKLKPKLFANRQDPSR
jgi:hypothetical protein